MSIDYYNILEIEKTASNQEVKTAFRRLAHKYHPDKGGDENKFKEINEAYQTLSSEEKRRSYDSFGSMGGFYAQSGPASGWNMNYADFSQPSASATATAAFFRKLPKWAWFLLMPIIIVITFIGITMVLLWVSFRTLQSVRR